MNTTTQPILKRRRLLFAGATLALAGLFPAAAVATERWETLEAIHWVENPHNSNQPGPCGELGPYQFRENTWRTYTTVPFYKANNRPASDEVAVRHYEWLKAGLVRAGLEVSPYNIALAWNGGLAAVVRGTLTAGTRNYAERVTNIVERLRQSQLASTR